MTARLLATRSLTEASGPSWTTILRSCGGYEAYLRSYRGVPSSQYGGRVPAARPALPAVDHLERHPRRGVPARDRPPRRPRRRDRPGPCALLGQIRSELEYRPIARHPRRPRRAHGARAGGHLVGERGDPAAVLPGERRAGLDRGGLVSRIRIVHRTGFTYEQPATASYNEARMLPHSGGEQFVLQAGARHPAGRDAALVPRLLGHARVDVRGAHAASRAVGHGDEPRRGAAGARSRAPSSTGPSCAEAALDDRDPRRGVHALGRDHAAARARRARRARSPRRARRWARPPSRSAAPSATSMEYMRGVTGVHSTAARGVGRAQGRLPGHRARRARRTALGRHPGALRLGLPAPRRGRGDRRRR